MKIKNNIDDIEKYLNNELSAGELNSFEDELRKNKKLADEVKLRIEVKDFLKSKDEIEYRSLLDEIKEDMIGDENIEQGAKKSKVIRMHPFRWQYAAAAVLLLGMITAAIFFMLRPAENERLYAQNFTPYNASDLVRSDEQAALTPFQSALNEYNSGNYEKSWKLFKDISSSNQDNAEAFFIRGISAMEINNFDDALSSFIEVANDQNSLYAEHAEWYMALCYLKKDDKENALKYLNKIIAEKNIYRNKATEIIEKLSD
ncbi:MAG TPA: tetratricopeptide repeat protein [Bacteroidales bacterium]|nr:tetratricopeptide repeat protein [Bacteroidales bacterium]HPS16729.1 tetratricopeptide repeat protein [Bacteroidales bacterium]